MRGKRIRGYRDYFMFRFPIGGILDKRRIPGKRAIVAKILGKG